MAARGTDWVGTGGWEQVRGNGGSDLARGGGGVGGGGKSGGRIPDLF